MVDPNKLKALDAEMSILSCLLKDPKLIPVYLDRLSTELFYLAFHKNIFSCLVEMYDQGIDIDIVTLVDYHHKTKGKDISFELVSIKDHVLSAQLIDKYVEICIEKLHYRKIRDLCVSAIHKISEGEKPEDIIQEIGGEISNIHGSDDEITLPEQMHLLNDLIDKRRHGDSSMYLWTGFQGIDRLMPTGINNTDLFIIAGRPSNGKSTLAIQIALNMIHQKRAILFFSIEMSTLQILSKAICIEANINLSNFSKGKLIPTEYENYAKTIGMFSQYPLKVIDRASSLNEIKSKAISYKQKRMCDVLFVDYLQLLPCKGENRNDAISQITGQLKRLSKQIQVPIILLSQLSRMNEKEKREPILSDLRDSGAIEQDADKVLFVHRSNLIDPNAIDKIKLDKDRDGEVGRLDVTFDRNIVRFREV